MGYNTNKIYGEDDTVTTGTFPAVFPTTPDEGDVHIVTSDGSATGIFIEGYMFQEISGTWIPITPPNTTNTAWTTPTLINGWVQYPAPYSPTQYMRDANGIVHMKGLIRNGNDGTVMFTLPVGYRPAIGQRLLFMCQAANQACRVDVESNGDVICVDARAYAAGAVVGWVSLANIHFLAES